MFDDLINWYDNLGSTTAGISYAPDPAAYQPSDYESLRGMLADPGYRNRAGIDWNSPTVLGRASAGISDQNGSGLMFNDRPSEGVYTAPADIQAQSIKNLANGGSNIPTQLGSNTPDKASAGINYGNLAKVGLLGAAMYAAGQGQNQQGKGAGSAPQIHAQDWASTYRPVSFQGTGPIGNASPYTNPMLAQSRLTREELIKRMQYEKGLLG
jgi:hypothetical protein